MLHFHKEGHMVTYAYNQDTDVMERWTPDGGSTQAVPDFKSIAYDTNVVAEFALPGDSSLVTPLLPSAAASPTPNTVPTAAEPTEGAISDLGGGAVEGYKHREEINLDSEVYASGPMANTLFNKPRDPYLGIDYLGLFLLCFLI